MQKISFILLFPLFLMACDEEIQCPTIGYECPQGTVACDPDTDGEDCVEEIFGDEGCEQTLYCMDLVEE